MGSALGPISQSLSGVAAFTKAVIDSSPWLLDPKTPEIPWRQEMFELKHLRNDVGQIRKPVFGVMMWDDYLKPWPPLQRAMRTTIEAVKKAGFEGIVTRIPPRYVLAD